MHIYLCSSYKQSLAAWILVIYTLWANIELICDSCPQAHSKATLCSLHCVLDVCNRMLLFDPKHVLWLASFSFGVFAEVFGRLNSFPKIVKIKGSDYNFIYLEETERVGKTYFMSLCEPIAVPVGTLWPCLFFHDSSFTFKPWLSPGRSENTSWKTLWHQSIILLT